MLPDHFAFPLFQRRTRKLRDRGVKDLFRERLVQIKTLEIRILAVDRISLSRSGDAVAQPFGVNPPERQGLFLLRCDEIEIIQLLIDILLGLSGDPFQFAGAGIADVGEPASVFSHAFGNGVVMDLVHFFFHYHRDITAVLIRVDYTTTFQRGKRFFCQAGIIQE